MNGHRPDPAGAYVLYWMQAARRATWNFALQRATDLCRELGVPLLILETLGCDDPWASDRFHAFVLQGMRDNLVACSGAGVTYHPYAELNRGDSRELVHALARHAAAVVTDDVPDRSVRRTNADAASQVPVALEAVDSNGLLPLRAADRVFSTAFSFRAHLQRVLPSHLRDVPLPSPLDRLRQQAPARVPDDIARRWPALSREALDAPTSTLVSFPIDHGVTPVQRKGGPAAAAATLRGFLSERLARYCRERNQPGSDASSGLSPYLHHGHISAHQVFAELMTRERWTTRMIAAPKGGQREGWWGASEDAEAFLDQLVTWRELGFNMAHLRADYDTWESLPTWARTTLEVHASDHRTHVYARDVFEAARTHDPLWNAAQRQLVRDGVIHNYLRMLWGKKILEWTRTPQEAAAVMIELNNKYALDGRDPNSYSGIFWVLGRYDRPWAPERPVFGSVRYMSSENTARKLRVRGYLVEYGA